MSEAKRIQRKRSRGWKMPAGAIYVGRPTRWGNPYQCASTPEARADAVRQYRKFLLDEPELLNAVRGELAGKDLACWCPTGQPCHASVLLEVANDPR